MADHLTFEQICVRNQTGYVCDAKSSVTLKNPISYDDVIFRLTTKCETSLLLMGSHHGELDTFGVDILPLVDSRSPFPEGDISNSDIGKMRETWEVMEEEGYHGLMNVGRIDVNSMPRNDSRILHQLPQFVNSLIHSLEAYFMFQKPNKAFLPNALNLWEPVENDQTVRFLVLLAWKFVKHPTVRLPTSPVIEMKTSPFKGVVESVLSGDNSMDDDDDDDDDIYEAPVSNTTPRSLADMYISIQNQKENMLNKIKGKEDVRTVTKTIISKSPKSLLDEESPFKKQKENLKMRGGEVTRTVTSSSSTTVTKKVLSPVKKTAVMTPVEDEIEAMDESTFTNKVVAAPVEDVEPVNNSTSRKRATKQTKITATPVVSKRGRRSVAQPPVAMEEEEEEEEEEDPEVTFRVRSEPVPLLKNSESVKASPVSITTEKENAPMITVDDIELPFETSISKPSGGRKSTAGRKSVGGRKSLLPEWPQDEQQEILTFFDNLNPAQTEATRVNLTCKYATMLYDRELSSKQFYMWEQKKGREVQKTNQKMTLEETEQQGAVVDFFKALSEAASEQSRVSFAIKYFQGQYNLAITSKQLYAWLSASAKAGKKVTKRR